MDVYHPDPRKNAALCAYAETGTVASAVRSVCVSRQTWYDWLRVDRQFAAAVEVCRSSLADDLETDAFRRAKEGSVPMIMFLLRTHRPGRYRERQTIEVVSLEVQSRLQRQADAMLELCQEHLDGKTALALASALANRLREVWS